MLISDRWQWLKLSIPAIWVYELSHKPVQFFPPLSHWWKADISWRMTFNARHPPPRGTHCLKRGPHLPPFSIRAPALLFLQPTGKKPWELAGLSNIWHEIPHLFMSNNMALCRFKRRQGYSIIHLAWTAFWDHYQVVFTNKQLLINPMRIPSYSLHVVNICPSWNNRYGIICCSG